MAGRPKGVKNKPKRALLALLQEHYPGYHPVLEMAKTANDENAPQDQRFQANKEIAPYVTPKLAAVHKTDEGLKPLEEWLEELDGLATED